MLLGAFVNLNCHTNMVNRAGLNSLKRLFNVRASNWESHLATCTTLKDGHIYSATIVFLLGPQLVSFWQRRALPRSRVISPSISWSIFGRISADLQLLRFFVFSTMAQCKPTSTGNPPSSSQSSQKKKPEPSNLIAEACNRTTHVGFRALTFPPQIHPRQRSSHPGEKINLVGKELATANYERDTFLKAGIKIEESRESAAAPNLPSDRPASVAAAGAKQDNGVKWLPKFPEEAIRKEDFKILWRR